MKLRNGQLEGVKVIELEPLRDERGFFARSYCEDTFRKEGLNTEWVQCNFTETVEKGAIRGMHWQEPPHGEIKLIRCEQGEVWDCLVDLRRDSPTFGKWESVRLSSENETMVYVPEGIAHGFQTLAPRSRLFYMMSTRYVPTAARGLRWNDPEVGIEWPLPVGQVGERDKEWAGLSNLNSQY